MSRELDFQTSCHPERSRGIFQVGRLLDPSTLVGMTLIEREKMHFKKMHGLGNDFVVIDTRDGTPVPTTKQIERIANRRWGVGCDTVVVLKNSEESDIFAHFYNSDGSESGACGNATRCIADIIMTETGKESCVIELTYDTLYCKKKGDLLVEVDMGVPKLEWQDIPMAQETDTLHVPLEKDNVRDPAAASMGNPHLVFFVDKLADIDVETLGPYFENHELFPERTNVEFVEVINNMHLRQKTWERGCGITDACGTGACAVMVSASRRGIVGRSCKVELDGGMLDIAWRESDGHVLMTGPVAYVFDGTLADSL